MAYNLEPRTIKENLLGLIGKNPHAEPRPANTREECFLADIAENGGGGGGLPPYTSADKGKGLILGEGSESETVVIVPEQTVTYDGETPALLTGADPSGFVVGTAGVMTVNGTSYEVEAEEVSGAVAFIASEGGSDLYVIGEAPAGIAFIQAGHVPGTYTVSLTASVPSVEPKWEKGNIVMPISQQFTTMFMTRLTAEVPKAIQAGVGVPVYAPAATEAATNEAEWDNAVSLIEKSFNEGILPVFYATPVDLIGAKAVLASSANSTWRINGLSTYYSTNGYVFRVDFDYILLLFEQKMVGLSTLVTLLQTP